MIRYFSADLYKLLKERFFLVPIVLSSLFGILVSFFMRNSTGDEGLISIISFLSSIIPLFFTSVATFFWGDAFTSRTINTMLMKSKSRFSLFLYKVLMSIVFSNMFIVIIYVSFAVSRVFILGEINWSILNQLALYQLPYYFCIILLFIFIFNYFDKVYQSYMVYMVVVLLFDNLMSYVTSNILETELFNQFFLFNQLKMVTGTGEFLTPSAIVAIVFTIIYFFITYYLFNIREFK